MSYILASLLGFLIGSIPFGLILSKVFLGIDPRTIGSGNIGATNVLRTGKKSLALATLLLDAAKGAAAIFLAHMLFQEQKEILGMVAGLAAILGHIFSPWLSFKGGKGVATAAGAILFICWPAGLATLVTWIAFVGITRYSSLGAIIGASLLPAYGFLFGGLFVALWTVPISIIVLYKHKDNIKRLREGVEPKIGHKSKKSTDSPQQ